MKYEYSNRFALRVINHQYQFKQSLESFINQQRVKQMQDSLKTQKRTKKVSNMVKDENGEYHLVKTEVPFTPEAFSLKGEGNHDDEI